MSLNFLEVAYAVNEIVPENRKAQLGSVQGVYFYKLFSKIPNPGLFLGFELSTGKVLLFSLRAPWLGVFCVPAKEVKREYEAGPNWKKYFAPAPCFVPSILNQKIVDLKALAGERIVEMYFENEAVLRFELFSAKPNWIFTLGKEKFSWRPESVSFSKGQGDFSVREFEGGEPGTSWVWQAFQHYKELQRKEALQRLVRESVQSIKLKQVSEQKLKRELQEQLRESTESTSLKTQAEALKAHLYENLKTTDGYVLIQDENQGVIKIPVDPKLSPSENVDLLFKRVKKLQRTQLEVQGRIDNVERSLQELQAQAQKAQALIDSFDEEKILCLTKNVEIDSEEPQPKSKLETGKEKKWKNSGLRSYLSKEGLKIWVGKNRKENEELVMRLANGNDLWMHLKSKPGSHAVIQVPKGKTASLDTLLDAAHLVAHFSGVSEESKFEVDYTFRKNIKRIAGADAFKVSYTQNKSLTLKLDAARMKSIFSFSKQGA